MKNLNLTEKPEALDNLEDLYIKTDAVAQEFLLYCNEFEERMDKKLEIVKDIDKEKIDWLEEKHAAIAKIRAELGVFKESLEKHSENFHPTLKQYFFYRQVVKDYSAKSSLTEQDRDALAYFEKLDKHIAEKLCKIKINIIELARQCFLEFQSMLLYLQSTLAEKEEELHQLQQDVKETDSVLVEKKSLFKIGIFKEKEGDNKKESNHKDDAFKETLDSATCFR